MRFTTVSEALEAVVRRWKVDSYKRQGKSGFNSNVKTISQNIQNHSQPLTVYRKSRFSIYIDI